MGAQVPNDGSAASQAHTSERTSLLHSFRPRNWSIGSSSSESSLTISSLDSSSSGSAFIPWYLDPPEDLERALPPPVESRPPSTKDNTGKGHGRILQVIGILVIGVFTSNADGSLVLATHSTIASEFQNLGASSWLMTAFALAGASFQNISGQLSDIFGRRPVLTVSYVLFALGCILVGSGQSMWHVILGRAISGGGGSALGIVGSLLIADLVPLRDIAAWQATLNLAATVGRSLGGPVGGWLADTVGWRWSFTGQGPIFLLAAIIGWLLLPKGLPTLPNSDQPEGEGGNEESANDAPSESETPQSKFSRIDFQATEAWWAINPVFPLSLLQQRNVLISYTIAMFQLAAQLGLMFSVPIYFQVSRRVSNAVAGAHLFPAVFGNALGAVFSGLLIKRTGRYQNVLVCGTLASSFSYILLFLTWHGNTSIWESLYIFPSGFGTGIAQTAVFTSIQASVSKKMRAPALAGMYLTISVGVIAGLAIVSATVMETVQWKLDTLLQGMGLDAAARYEIVKKAASDIDYLDKADHEVYSAIVESYMLGLSWSHLVSIAFCGVAFVAALVMTEVKV
ncbi:related to multidrug resistance protein [Cephalotrichum gorgonifer]|uniref:Related to multidrug resistance protein n=1 Tax=Cephalotrichum gorgonifer TaxID=2041049 RepID=A0AAE8MWL3_9PEZI|nr:related to multidrug resistance protein [Cephalotrichum gorgonifer]